jgi:ketosteroid isomerase-like protein
MSPQETLEVVRRSFATFNAREVEDLVALCNPDSEWLPFRAQLEGMVYRGHEGIRQFVQDMDDDWEVYRIDPQEFHGHGDRIVVTGHVRALSRSSGVDVYSEAGFLFELRAGRISRVVSYSDPAAALEAVKR